VEAVDVSRAIAADIDPRRVLGLPRPAYHRPGPGEHLLVYDGRGGRQTSGYEGSVDVNRRDSMRAAGEAAHRKTLNEHRPHLAEWCRTTRDPFTVPG